MMSRALPALAALSLLAACSGPPPRSIRLATTTSVDNTGLLDALLPAFKARTGVEVMAVAVGTGKALKLARNGDVDLVLAHDPEAEAAFVAQGFGRDRTALFFNEFVLAGPPEDPAGVKGAKGAAEAFSKVAVRGLTFISRGDKSGTHSRELSIWKAAGLKPTAPWYLESGQGMGPTLVIAGEKRAYTLSDSATLALFAEKTGLAPLFAGKPPLRNDYSVILVDPKANPKAAYDDARAFLEWMKSPEARAIVAGFKKDGKTLFRLEE
ncbi:MAG: extracellular solute-binding protein [Elusimicrobia bacterium]|nr:extracellular solute-binding protein [Elusimicrobiota bacterium]